MYLFQCNSDYIMWFQHKIMFIYEKNKNLGNGPGGIYFRHIRMSINYLIYLLLFVLNTVCKKKKKKIFMNNQMETKRMFNMILPRLQG